jgi:hypothetical protein
MRTKPLIIDGLAGPLVITRNELTGKYSITVGGQQVPGTGQREYNLPTTDGHTVAATVARPKLFDPYPTIEIAGVAHRTGPRIPTILAVLALVPLALVGLGGLIGGLIGGLGAVVNLRIARGGQSTAVKAILMVMVLVVATLTWISVATAAQAMTAAP